MDFDKEFVHNFMSSIQVIFKCFNNRQMWNIEDNDNLMDVLNGWMNQYQSTLVTPKPPLAR